LSKNYRGFHTIEETIDLIEGRSQSTLISTELILALLKYEISKRPRQAIFIDGFPRGFDQINYSIFLKELLGYRDDPDFFTFIDLPESIIDERIKYRVICPICKTPRSLKLLATKEAGYDDSNGTFYLKCDTPSCNGKRLVPKEGDELGIEPIRARLETDGQIFKQLLQLQGVPKVLLRNSVPVDKAAEYVDEYELTPAYGYEKGAEGKVKILETPWVVNDDDGVPSYSLLPPAVVLGFIKQTAKALEL
jgi:adenylate kinase family enzyme